MNASSMATRLVKVGLLAAALILLGACVEEEPSMELQASAVYEGSAEATDNGWLIECDIGSAEPDSVDLWHFRGNLDIGEVLTYGQVGGNTGTYTINAEILNELESTESDSEEFEGLRGDQNSILANRADIRYPPELNNFDGADQLQDLEKQDRFSTKLDSGGGGAIYSLPLFDSGDLQDLRGIYTNLLDLHDLSAGESIRIIAEVTIRGSTFSGNEVKSNTFEFPIYVTDRYGEGDPPPYIQTIEGASEDELSDLCLTPDLYRSTPYCRPEC